MDYCLVRLTSNDYRNFRKAYAQIVYSFAEKGTMFDREAEKFSSKIATETNLRTKTEFLKDLESREMYFFQVDGETKGYVELIFKGRTCDIYEFSVFEHGKGLGTILFEETMRIIKERECTKIELWCPFPGAQVFWKKNGFQPFYKNKRMYFRKKVR